MFSHVGAQTIQGRGAQGARRLTLVAVSALSFCLPIPLGRDCWGKPPAASSTAGDTAWSTAAVPDQWQGQAQATGYSWYRCWIQVPSHWRAEQLVLNVESVDDARQIYWNGELVGQIGAFPPHYRSGLGDEAEHLIHPRFVKLDQPNLLAVRVYQNDGRGGFNVAAPVLFGPGQALRLEGPWQYRTGDDLEWAKAAPPPPGTDQFTFSKFEDAQAIQSMLRRLEGDLGAHPPSESVTLLETEDPLRAELVLSEPAIGQPVSLKFDERGRMWVAQYLQYPEPAGLKMVSRDKHLRTVYDRVPPPPPDHFRGQDKITIHEDTDGDGLPDKHKTFIDGLNIVSSFALGRGGVWVLNPPYLLFYPDRDGNDVPDSSPEVHLEGFGLEDTHSVANSLRWGPDGWLYAAQGSTVTGKIKRPAAPEAPVRSMGQLIWRYHPQQRRYEIFAEGGGNAFGVEIDAKGRIFSGHNGGNTRGFHYVQGGYYLKGFGKHGSLSNPYAFGYFPPMPHPSVPRFTHTFIIYEADRLPPTYHGDLLAVAPLQSHVVRSKIEPLGSTFQTHDVGYPLTSSDPWFRPVDIQLGPDGAVYVADFYEQRIDHASHYQGRVHRASGRIYRLTAGDDPDSQVPDLSLLSDQQLLSMLGHPNRWVRQTALRLIGDRQSTALIEPLLALLRDPSYLHRLEALWALHLCGGFTAEVGRETLMHPDPHVRLWSVRLLCDDREVPEEIAGQLAQLAMSEEDVEVRSQLACSARRLPAAASLPIVRQLLEHAEDVDDPHLPLLLWWAIEDKAATNSDAVVSLMNEPKVWQLALVEQHIASRLMRRYAQAGRRSDLLTCAQLLQLAPEPAHAQRLMQGFEEAFEGREIPALPDELVAAMSRVGGGSLVLRLRQDDAAAVAEALRIIGDSEASSALRMQYVQVLGQIDQPRSIQPLLDLVASSEEAGLRQAALTSLQSYEEESIARQLLARYSQFPQPVREVALSVLASRRTWTLELLEAARQDIVPADQVPITIVRKILLHDDAQIRKLATEIWGEIPGATSEQMRQRIAELEKVIGTGSGNPYDGRMLFEQTCGKCHVLFEEGGQIGPNLTVYQRDDLAGMLLHVVNPTAEIREGFENYLVLTTDGQALNGFIQEQDNELLILRSVDGQSRMIPRDQIDELREMQQSLMPEGLLDSLNDQQIRDLFAYLRSPQPLP